MAEDCKAPVFEANNGLVCLLLAIIYALTLAGLVVLFVLFIWLPPIRDLILCRIKQIRFRMTYCTKGNRDPNIML